MSEEKVYHTKLEVGAVPANCSKSHVACQVCGDKLMMYSTYVKGQVHLFCTCGHSIFVSPRKLAEMDKV